MGPVTERAKLRAPAATERNGAASRVDLASPLVAESKGASDHQLSVLVGDDLGRLLTHDDFLPAAGWSYARRSRSGRRTPRSAPQGRPASPSPVADGDAASPADDGPARVRGFRPRFGRARRSGRATGR